MNDALLGTAYGVRLNLFMTACWIVTERGLIRFLSSREKCATIIQVNVPTSEWSENLDNDRHALCGTGKRCGPNDSEQASQLRRPGCAQ